MLRHASILSAVLGMHLEFIGRTPSVGVISVARAAPVPRTGEEFLGVRTLARFETPMYARESAVHAQIRIRRGTDRAVARPDPSLFPVVLVAFRDGDIVSRFARRRFFLPPEGSAAVGIPLLLLERQLPPLLEQRWCHCHCHRSVAAFELKLRLHSPPPLFAVPSAFDAPAPPLPRRFLPPVAVLPVQHDLGRRMGHPVARAAKRWRCGGGGVGGVCCLCLRRSACCGG